ncbi:MAG: hypothetical protein WAX11_02795, partial [Gemmiger qucibialis]
MIYLGQKIGSCELRIRGVENENIDDETFGMLFIADINSFEELHSEIEKILISDKLVENWTY